MPREDEYLAKRVEKLETKLQAAHVTIGRLAMATLIARHGIPKALEMTKTRTALEAVDAEDAESVRRTGS